MRVFARRELYWKGNRLFRWGSDAVLAEVVPNDRWSGMWRVRMADGRLSGMANLSWACDVAMAAVLTKLNRQARQETVAGSPPISEREEEAPGQPPASPGAPCAPLVEEAA
jgi:hypothetical protein